MAFFPFVLSWTVLRLAFILMKVSIFLGELPDLPKVVANVVDVFHVFFFTGIYSCLS